MCKADESAVHAISFFYMEANRDDDLKDNDDDATDCGGEVCKDPVVYWTSSKDGLGMEELLLSVGNSAFAVEGI